MKLCYINNNDEYIIKKINLDKIKKIRLYDLGLIPGNKIKKEFASIFNDPCCYKVNNTFISIRNNDAYYIEVSNV